MPRSRIQNDAFVERKPAETRLLRMAGTHGTRSAATTETSLFGPEKSNPWLPTRFLQHRLKNFVLFDCGQLLQAQAVCGNTRNLSSMLSHSLRITSHL